MITQKDVFTICDYCYLRLRTLKLAAYATSLAKKNRRKSYYSYPFAKTTESIQPLFWRFEI